MDKRDEMYEAQKAYYEALDAMELQLAAELGVPKECAAAVLYLRSRSRWTPEMEAQLIDSYKNPNKTPVPLSDVVTGEWRGEHG